MEDANSLPEDRRSVTPQGQEMVSRAPRRAVDADVMPAYEDFSQEEVIVRPSEPLRIPVSNPSRVDRRRES